MHLYSVFISFQWEFKTDLPLRTHLAAIVYIKKLLWTWTMFYGGDSQENRKSFGCTININITSNQLCSFKSSIATGQCIQ